MYGEVRRFASIPIGDNFMASNNNYFGQKISETQARMLRYPDVIHTFKPDEEVVHSPNEPQGEKGNENRGF